MATGGGGPGWCGTAAAEWGKAAHTLNPCHFNTAAAVLLVLATAVAAALSGGTARRLAAAARGRPYLLPPSGSAVHGVQLAAAAALAALHGFALLWVTTQVPQPPYVAFSESLLLLAWALFAVSGAGVEQAAGSLGWLAGRHPTSSSAVMPPGLAH